MLGRILIGCIFFTSVATWADPGQRSVQSEVGSALNSLSQSLDHKFRNRLVPSDWGAVLSDAIKRFEPYSVQAKLYYYDSILASRPNLGIYRFLGNGSVTQADADQYQLYISRLSIGQLSKILNGFKPSTDDALVALNSLSQSLSHKFDNRLVPNDWGAVLSQEITRFAPYSVEDRKAYYSSLLLTHPYPGMQKFLDGSYKPEEGSSFGAYISRLAMGKLMAFTRSQLRNSDLCEVQLSN